MSYSFWSDSVQRIAFSLLVNQQPLEDWFQSTQLNVVANPDAELSSTRPNQRSDHMGSTFSLFCFCFTFVWCDFLFFIFVHQKPWALRPSSSTVESSPAEKQDFCAQRVVGRKQIPWSLKYLFRAPPISFTAHWPGRSAGFWTTHTRQEKGRRWFRGVEPWSLASVQNQPFLSEGRRLSPLDWHLILFYTGIEL